jgi:hypothetical protein
MSKPRIFLSVLCGAERTNWVNPLLFDALMTLQTDPRFSLTNVMAYGIDRVETVRNRAVQYARDEGADFLIMADNDMVLPSDFGDILENVITSGKSIVGFAYARVMSKDFSIEMLTLQGGGRPDGGFLRVGAIGSGVLILSAEVWRVIPKGPWFRWQVNDDEVLSRKLSEDYSFCELAREHGLTVWGHSSFAGHLKTSDITKQGRKSS